MAACDPKTGEKTSLARILFKKYDADGSGTLDSVRAAADVFAGCLPVLGRCKYQQPRELGSTCDSLQIEFQSLCYDKGYFLSPDELEVALARLDPEAQGAYLCASCRARMRHLGLSAWPPTRASSSDHEFCCRHY